MNCPKCGADMKDQKVCSRCGADIEQPSPDLEVKYREFSLSELLDIRTKHEDGEDPEEGPGEDETQDDTSGTNFVRSRQVLLRAPTAGAGSEDRGEHSVLRRISQEQSLLVVFAITVVAALIVGGIFLWRFIMSR